jgi:nicotinate-nucleotide pyrophosphorylase (carboxylating)
MGEVAGPDMAAVRGQLKAALAEDLGSGDVTSLALVAEGAEVRGELVAREPGVAAGLAVAGEVFALADEAVRLTARVEDGAALEAGAVLGEVAGPARGILGAERTALNLLQRLSGIATLTRRYVERVAGTGAQIYDTRKTTPLWRVLEKYAVRAGGGRSHRMGLYDQVLIKDNHIALGEGQSEAELVRSARAASPRGMVVEIEVGSLQELLEALEGEPDVVLLDNMTPALVSECVRAVRRLAGRRPALEASGGITLENVRAYAEAGVDRISIGALTHSAPALDIGLDIARG